MQPQAEQDMHEIEEEEEIDEGELHQSSDYEPYLPSAAYFEPAAKPKRNDQKVEPGPVYDLPQVPTSQFKKNEPDPSYDLPQPLTVRYTQVKRNIVPPKVVVPVDDEYVYEEITPPLNRAVRSRPSSGDFSEFTPEQLSLLQNLLQRMNEGDIYGMTARPSSPLPQPPQEDLPLYDDTVSRPAKPPAKQYPLYENEDVVKPGEFEDIYDKIDDDSEPEPVKPPVPPKPNTMKRKPKQQAKVVKLVPPPAKETRPSTNEERISKFIF